MRRRVGRDPRVLLLNEPRAVFRVNAPRASILIAHIQFLQCRVELRAREAIGRELSFEEKELAFGLLKYFLILLQNTPAKML